MVKEPDGIHTNLMPEIVLEVPTSGSILFRTIRSNLPSLSGESINQEEAVLGALANVTNRKAKIIHKDKQNIFIKPYLHTL
jgi:hypothetical protein